MSREVLSVVVPVYNEADVIETFLEQLLAALAPCDMELQVVLVDDGSTDDTVARIERFRRKMSGVFLVRLARNFGKEAAVCAGLDVASGDAVVVMDCDLQDPPALVPAFVDAWHAGAQIVYGARRDRTSDSWPKRATARAFYRVFNRMADRPIPPDAGDFRLMDRQVVEVLRLLPERQRFMKGLFAWPGFRVDAIPFDRPARLAGESKWPGTRLWRYAIDGMFGFSRLPLRAWAYVGVTIVLLGALFALVVVLRALIGIEDVPGYASLVVLITTLAGLQICGIGIVGEYVGRTLDEAKGRPVYVVVTSDLDLPEHLPVDGRRSELATYWIAKKRAGGE